MPSDEARKLAEEIFDHEGDHPTRIQRAARLLAPILAERDRLREERDLALVDRDDAVMRRLETLAAHDQMREERDAVLKRAEEAEAKLREVWRIAKAHDDEIAALEARLREARELLARARAWLEGR